jgi:hypothetical protein
LYTRKQACCNPTSLSQNIRNPRVV